MLSGYIYALRIQRAENRIREARACIREIESRRQEIQAITRNAQSRARSEAHWTQDLMRRTDAVADQVKILQAQLDLRRNPRHLRRLRRNRLKAAQRQCLCCTNCAKSR